MFDVSKYIAVKTIRRMRETIGDQSTVKDGYADLGWALADKDATVRMTTWLYQLLEREKLAKFDLPEDSPWPCSTPPNRQLQNNRIDRRASE